MAERGKTRIGIVEGIKAISREVTVGRASRDGRIWDPRLEPKDDDLTIEELEDIEDKVPLLVQNLQ